MCHAITSMVCATAKMALVSPRLPKRRRKRWYCAPRKVLRVRVAAQAASTIAVRNAVLPLRARPEGRLPADSWLPGHSPAQEARCAAVGKRVMSGPASARITHAVRGPSPGIAEQLNRLGERGDLGLHLRIQPIDRRGEVIDVVQQHAQQQRVVLAESTLQRQ